MFYELARNQAIGEIPSRYSAERTVTKCQCMCSEPKHVLNVERNSDQVGGVGSDHVCLPTLNPALATV